jgi:DNA-binding response OmpR family regulator
MKAQKEGRNSLKKGSILLVVENSELRSLLGQMIESHNFDVFLAQNGKEAFSLLDKITPSLILLELELPDANGKELLEQIDFDSQFAQKMSNISIIIYSATIDRDSKWIRLANELVEKSSSMDVLLNTIEKVLS